MKKIILYLISATAFLFISCAKVEVTSGSGGGGFSWSVPFNPNTNSFDSAAMHFIELPPYRYFIYKDSATGSIDSVGVTESNLNMVLKPAVTGNPSTPGYYYYTYTLTLTRFTSTGNQTWYKGYASCDSDYKNTPRFIDSDFNLSVEATRLPSFWYSFTSLGNLQFTKIPSLIVEGTTHFNVHKFSATNGLSPSDVNYLATAFYWVKGIGIIKRETRTFNTGKTSLLVRFG